MEWRFILCVDEGVMDALLLPRSSPSGEDFKAKALKIHFND